MPVLYLAEGSGLELKQFAVITLMAMLVNGLYACAGIIEVPLGRAAGILVSVSYLS